MGRKYTPGPWETIGGPGTALAVCAPDGGDIIAEVHTGNVVDRDLIAVAPDMFEALERASKQLDVFEGESVSRTEARNAVRAIIAKVKEAKA